jgi:drug/metabolite transporter (DMT)-like permease
LTGPILAIIAAIGFAGKAVLVRMAYASDPKLDATTLVALRMALSLPFCLFMLWWQGRGGRSKPLTKRDWMTMIWLGFIGYYIASFLDFLGLEYISSALERILLFTYPTLVVLISAVLYRKPVHSHAIIALLLTVAGTVVSFANDMRFTSSTSALGKGTALVLGSAVFYALFLIGSGHNVERVGSLRFSALALSIAAGFVLAQFFLLRPASALILPAKIYWLGLALAWFSTGLPIFLTIEAIRLVGASRVSIAGSVGPIVTIWLGHIFLDEPVTWLQMGGAALVLAGVGLITVSRAEAPKAV